MYIPFTSAEKPGKSLRCLIDVTLKAPKIKGRHAASGTACKAATSSALWRSWPSGGQMMECPVKNLPPQRRYSWHFVEILQTEVQSRFAGGTMVGSLGLISNRVMD